MMGSPSSPSQQSTGKQVDGETKHLTDEELTLYAAAAELQSVDVGVNAALSRQLVANQVTETKGLNDYSGQT